MSKQKELFTALENNDLEQIKLLIAEDSDLKEQLEKDDCKALVSFITPEVDIAKFHRLLAVYETLDIDLNSAKSKVLYRALRHVEIVKCFVEFCKRKDIDIKETLAEEKHDILDTARMNCYLDTVKYLVKLYKDESINIGEVLTTGEDPILTDINKRPNSYEVFRYLVEVCKEECTEEVLTSVLASDKAATSVLKGCDLKLTQYFVELCNERNINIEVLLKKFIDSDSRLKYASCANSMYLLKLCQKAGIDINGTLSKYDFLKKAASDGDIEVFQCFIDLYKEQGLNISFFLENYTFQISGVNDPSYLGSVLSNSCSSSKNFAMTNYVLKIYKQEGVDSVSIYFSAAKEAANCGSNKAVELILASMLNEKDVSNREYIETLSDDLKTKNYGTTDNEKIFSEVLPKQLVRAVLAKFSDNTKINIFCKSDNTEIVDDLFANKAEIIKKADNWLACVNAINNQEKFVKSLTHDNKGRKKDKESIGDEQEVLVTILRGLTQDPVSDSEFKPEDKRPPLPLERAIDIARLVNEYLPKHPAILEEFMQSGTNNTNSTPQVVECVNKWQQREDEKAKDRANIKTMGV
jgi:hypothetical protein